MKISICPVLALLLCVPFSATAQTATPPVAAVLAPADQSALDRAHSLRRNEELWNKALDWKETGSSLPSVVARVQTLLGEGAPRFEVREPTATQSTFVLDQAPLGPTLCSLALLSNCRVWVFSDHVIVAPESLLSPEERALVKGRAGGDWTLSPVAGGRGWSGREEEDRVAVGIIGADLKARLAAKGEVPPVVPEPPVATAPGGGTHIVTDSAKKAPFELPFGELQPAAQQVLQNLVDERAAQFPQGQKPSILSPSVVVCFDDTQPGQLHLFLRSDALFRFLTDWRVASNPTVEPG